MRKGCPDFAAPNALDERDSIFPHRGTDVGWGALLTKVNG